MSKSLSVGLTVLLLLGGCAYGVKHDYQSELGLGIATSASVAVATLDHRLMSSTARKARTSSDCPGAGLETHSMS